LTGENKDRCKGNRNNGNKKTKSVLLHVEW
jgi:hypothetical protein